MWTTRRVFWAFWVMGLILVAGSGAMGYLFAHFSPIGDEIAFKVAATGSMMAIVLWILLYFLAFRPSIQIMKRKEEALSKPITPITP